MYFKRIELNGFKSFADPVTIEFTDGITCIVGPNGSGKSNISDALRWVLGEQSPKSLRGGKMEDVIFAGTQSRRAKGMAEVTLVIDNTERTLPLDFSEVGITRRMYRSGENEYMINRTPCRLRDIRELIMDTGIGVEGYSIIGQGKIADIVSNRMESRREIFEEAAGIVKYRSRKEETQKKLENSKLNLDRVDDIVNEIEGRIDGLAEESRKAQEYVELRDKYRSLGINILLRNIAAAEEHALAEKESLAELEQSLDKLRSERDIHDEALRSIKEQEAASEERLAALREEYMNKSSEITRITGAKELNAQKLESLENELARLNEQLAQTEEKLRRLNESEQELLDQKQSAAARAESSAAELSEKEALASAASAEYEKARIEADSLKNRMFEVSSQAVGYSAEVSSAENLRQGLQRRIERLKENRGEADCASAAVRKQAFEVKKALEELEGKQKKLNEDLLSVSDDINKAIAEAAKASRKSEELRISAGQLTARKKLLEELEKSYEGYGGGVRFLMSQNVKGIIGVLGELLVVPSGWELAIETVLGAKMQDIVCQNDDTAREAIALLKKNQAGRLTFLPVDSLRVQRPLSTASVENCRGFLGLASDMVSCSSGHQLIVDYMLGKVVVCRTLDDAIAMSKLGTGGLRFVSLDGELVNAAGAITGGSVKNNTANILIRKAETVKLEEKLSAMAAEIEAAALALKEAEKQKADSDAEKLRITEEDSKLRLDIAVKSRELGELNTRIKDSESSENIRLSELAELEKELEKASEEIRLSENKHSMALKRADEIRAELEEAQKASPQLMQRAEELRNQASDARLSAASEKLRLQQIEEKLQSLTEGRKELDAEKAGLGAQIDTNRLQRQQTDVFSETAADALAQMEEEKNQTEEELKSAEEKRRTLSQESDRLEDERRGMDSSIYDMQMKKHEADLRLARFEAQTDSFKERMFDEFSLSFAQAAELKDPDFVMSRGVKDAREFKEKMQALGDVNIKAIEEYKEVKERYDFLSSQRADLVKAIDELNTVIDDTDALIKARFKESFDSVVDNFESCFRELFSGGSAKLSLEDPSNPMQSAIEIEAQPPGKRLQNINLLSGGEKTMTAIALMFAVLKSKPTPFCILDEVEAALDENNIECFASYLRNFKNTQFALVTHQKATMEHADVMYGVTMPEHGVSKLLSLRLGDEIEI